MRVKLNLRHLAILGLLLVSCFPWRQQQRILLVLPESDPLREAPIFRELSTELLLAHFPHRVALEFTSAEAIGSYLKPRVSWPFSYPASVCDVIIWGSLPHTPIPEQTRQEVARLRQSGGILIAYRYRVGGLDPDWVVEPAYEELGRRQAAFLEQLPSRSPLVLLSRDSNIPEAVRSYEAVRAKLLEKLLEESRHRFRSFPVLLDTEWRSEAELQNIFRNLPNRLQLHANKTVGILCPSLACGQAALRLEFPGFLALSIVAETSSGSEILEPLLANNVSLQLLTIENRPMVRTALMLARNLLAEDFPEKREMILPSEAAVILHGDVPHVQIKNSREWKKNMSALAVIP
ncbi:MAG: hypothetical protein AAF975_01690 [Spirochaetota bacterium]